MSGKMDGLLQAAARMMRPGVDQQETLAFAGMVVLAALFFTVGGVFMKLSEGLTKFWPSMIVFTLFVTGAAERSPTPSGAIPSMAAVVA
jgi:hypothetical protein